MSSHIIFIGAMLLLMPVSSSLSSMLLVVSVPSEGRNVVLLSFGMPSLQKYNKKLSSFTDDCARVGIASCNGLASQALSRYYSKRRSMSSNE